MHPDSNFLFNMIWFTIFVHFLLRWGWDPLVFFSFWAVLWLLGFGDITGRQPDVLFLLQMAGDFKCPVAGPRREQKLYHSVPLSFTLFFHPTEFAKSNFVTKYFANCRFMDYRLHITVCVLHTAVMSTTMISCIQSSLHTELNTVVPTFVCTLEYPGSFEKDQLHFTTRDCVLISLECCWCLGNFTRSLSNPKVQRNMEITDLALSKRSSG